MNLKREFTMKNILVVGDVMLDIYYIGSVKRISPEAPVPVFKKIRERSSLGGAANVASNLVAANQNVFMMSVIGNDSNGENLRAEFNAKGINQEMIISSTRSTTSKTRFLASNNQQVMRLDIEDTEEISDVECETLLSVLEEKKDQFDLIVLSDYLKGVLSFEFTQKIIKIAQESNIPLIVDVKDPKIEKYNGAYLLKPNLKELHDLTGLNVEGDEEIISASEQLRKQCQCKYVLTTCGARGMVLVGGDKPYFVKSVVHEVFDVTGAGDTTIAYLAACMANGFNMEESVRIANLAAGIQVSKVGTSAVYWEEVRNSLDRKDESTINKILFNDSLDEFRKGNSDKKIVFTNGCFDILHIGHIRYLKEASKLGDLLVIGLNSDSSVKRTKGNDRPVNTEFDRAEMLCALDFVDYVVLFEDDTPLELIKKIQPNVLVKGGDYSGSYVVGTDEVIKNGGKLVLIPYIEGKSTSGIIEKIKS